MAAKFAALTTPPVDTAGVPLLGCNAPPMDADPVSAGWTSCPCAVIVTPVEACVGFQVAVQRPLLSEFSGKAGSPEENVAVTLPEVSGVPQSSTTVTSIAVGHAAAAVKPVPSSVKTGKSWVGTHPAAWGRSSVSLAEPFGSELPVGSTEPAGSTSKRTSIW